MDFETFLSKRSRATSGTMSSPSFPRSFARLLPRGPYVPLVGPDAFVEQMAARAGVDRERAKRAIDAVLETLAERIAGGEVDDLTSGCQSICTVQ